MKSNLISSIKKNLLDFSKSQRLIADYILNDYDKAAFMTAAKLGQTVGVSESTVVRFAVELGYSGYPMLQKSLKELVKNKLTSMQRIEIVNKQIGNDEDIISRVLNMDIDRIKKTIEETSRENFKIAVETIISSKVIYIIGTGSASALARFLYFYFNLMFDNVKLISNSSASEMFEHIFNVNSNDVIIGISFPRYSKLTIKSFKYASSCGSKIIAITDTNYAPLTEYADHVLTARSDMDSFVDSLVAPLSLINSLIVAIGLKKHNEISNNFVKLEKIWDEYEVYEKLEEKN